MGSGGDNKSASARLRAAERERQCIELRLMGLSFHDIAMQLGFKDASGAFRSYRRAFRRIPKKAAERARDEQLERLDRLRVKQWGRLLSLKSGKKIDTAVVAALRIEQREAQLLGLDAPQQLELKQEEDPEVVNERQRLIKELERLTPEEQAQYAALLRKVQSHDDAA